MLVSIFIILSSILFYPLLLLACSLSYLNRSSINRWEMPSRMENPSSNKRLCGFSFPVRYQSIPFSFIRFSFSFLVPPIHASSILPLLWCPPSPLSFVWFENDWIDSLEVILNFNTNLLADLEPRVKNWNTNQRIGDVFLQFVSSSFSIYPSIWKSSFNMNIWFISLLSSPLYWPLLLLLVSLHTQYAYMKVYTQYVKDFPTAQQTFDSVKTKKKFATFLHVCTISRLIYRNLPRYLIYLTYIYNFYPFV